MGLGRAKKWAPRCVGAIILLSLGVFGIPFVLREVAVRKVLELPSASLTESEVMRVQRYIMGDCWWQLPGTLISEERQAALAEAAVRRAAGGAPFYQCDLLSPLAIRWQTRGAFPSLPYAVNAAVRRGSRHAAEIINNVFAERGTIDLYVDAEYVLNSSDNSLLLTGILSLEMRTLNKHCILCLQMLQRDGVLPSCKEALLLRVADNNEGAEWFAGREDLLVELRQLEDEKINENIDKILDQIRAARKRAFDTEFPRTRTK